MKAGTAALPAADGHHTQLQLLREAVAALEAGDATGCQERIDRLAQRREQKFASGVVELAQRVHQAISDMNLDSRLACMAEQDIPDACSNLDHVVRLTEQAAHRTLDLVDESRSLLDQMSRHQHELMTHVGVRNSAAGDGAAISAHADAIAGGMSTLRVNLSALAQAQEYQDISGQLIRRVIGLVGDVESALVQLLQAAGVDLKNYAAAPINNDSSKLLGPAAKNATSQQDADSLLDTLGF